MPPPLSDWPRALALLDEALALPAPEREPWLARTAAHEPQVLPLLRKLLDAHVRVEAHELLLTLPKLQRAAHGAAEPDAGAPGLRVGPFELVELLGRGGMGTVWRARHADGRLKRDVAVKLPAASANPHTLATLRERFARERDFLAQLQHPHIARLYDAGVSDDGQPFLAMEYVAGQPIDAWCDAQRLTVAGRLALFQQVLDAVAYAHQQLVLHRDLKPGNVLVDGQGQVRLLDFGIARLLPPDTPGQAPGAADDPPAANLTEQAGAAFTLGHAAPEQVNRGALSTATDVYALGVMLYQLLTGLSPYQPARDTRGALEDAVLLATPASPSSRSLTVEALAARQTTAAALRKALRGDLDTILAQALKKNPSERYPSVAALADDLRRHAARLPISARADGWAYRARLFVARHRLAVSATALASCALVGTAGVAVWQARVSAANAAIAQKEAARANAAQQFFAGLLSRADPEKNKAITAADRLVIDQALATAERDFADAPETLAVVLRQLGEIYERLGVPAKVLAVQKRRVALLATLPSAPADDLVDAHLALGKALGESPSADERAQAMARLTVGRDLALARQANPRYAVQALCLMADLHLSQSRQPEAHALATEAVALAERVLPNPHPDLAWAYGQKATTTARLGDHAAARALYRQAIAVDATGRGRGAVEQLTERANLANTEYLAGDYLASRREALAALAFGQEHLGPTEATLTPLRLRAVLASERAGQLDEAVRLARDLMAPDLASDDGFRVGRALFAQGVVAMARSDFDAASVAFDAARPGLASNGVFSRSLVLQQATLSLKRGDLPAAHERLSALLATIRAKGAAGTDEDARAAERLAVVLARMGRLDEARTLVQEACAVRDRRLKDNHPDRVRCNAYAVLLDGNTDGPGKRSKLQRLWTTLTQAREDNMALAKGLQDSAKAQGSAQAGAFPLFD